MGRSHPRRRAQRTSAIEHQRRPISPWIQSELQDAIRGLALDDLEAVDVRTGGQSRCVMLEAPTGRQFVLKLFDRENGVWSPLEVARTEFDALRRFSGIVACDPTISVPEPLDLFPTLPAYLMTYVEGTNIRSHLQHHMPDKVEMRATTKLILRGLATYHRSCGVYGDFQPDNVLLATREAISLIDPTMPYDIFRDLEKTTPWSPMSVDLGYWVYSAVARGFRQSLRNPLAVWRLLRFTRTLLVAAVEERQPEDRAAFVRAVFDVVRAHLDQLRVRRGMRTTVLARLSCRVVAWLETSAGSAAGI